MDVEPLLKTRQVADLLGVSVSTAKRWIDSGQIAATRTVGRHRLVPRSNVVRFAARSHVGAERVAPDVEPALVDPSERLELLVEPLVQSLRVGLAEPARQIIDRAIVDHGAPAVGDRLIRPAMERVGHAWMVGTWDIYQEHRATRIVAQALQHAITAVEPAAGLRPLAVGASPEGDPFVLPGLLCELTLVAAGWEVHNLGVDLPLRSLARAVDDLKPRLAFLPVSSVADPGHFVHEYTFVYEAAGRAGTAIIVGGRALDSEVRSRLVLASCGDRMVHLAEFARHLLAAPTP